MLMSAELSGVSGHSYSFWNFLRSGMTVSSLIIVGYVLIGLTCYLLCRAPLLIFRLDITCIVLLMCCTADMFLELPTIYLHFCFVPLTSRFRSKVQCLFCNFCFWKIFDGLRIVTWTWSYWYRSKFYFCNYLTWMLHLPCSKSY